MGGWVRQNAYVCLQGGWVGVAKCLRNHKNHRKGCFAERNKWAIGDQNRGKMKIKEKKKIKRVELGNQIHV